MKSGCPIHVSCNYRMAFESVDTWNYQVILADQPVRMTSSSQQKLFKNHDKPKISWKKTYMMTSSSGNIFRIRAICVGNSLVTGEFPAQRPVTRSFDVFFDWHPNKRLSKQWWGWWYEMPLHPLWRHCNVYKFAISIVVLMTWTSAGIVMKRFESHICTGLALSHNAYINN